MNRIHTNAVCLILCLTAASARADEKLAGIACRSVHLVYPAPEGTAFINTVSVETSAKGTYFCVCGFNHGYFGIQELGNGKKLVIFSVWDPGKQNDPNAVAAEQRVKLIEKDPETRVGRFGNEGTGGQSFLDIDWKPDTPYRFLVTSRAVDDRTAYSAYVAIAGAEKWRLIASFSTITGGNSTLGGYYSFVEDFRRNRVSATEARRASYGPGWVRDAKLETWTPLVRARFTADKNPSLAIDAGTLDGRFFLATGGATENTHTPLSKELPSLEPKPALVDGLPEGFPPLP